MNKKEKVICIVLASVAFVVLIVMFIISMGGSKVNTSSSVKASVSSVEFQNTEVLNAARKMASDNAGSLKPENVYTIKELVSNKYLTGDEINPATGKEYSDDTRVVVVYRNNKIEDVYITNILFKEKLSCSSVCYFDSDNYISFNNDTYRILKMDQQGSIYITNNDTRTTDSGKIDSALKNVFNSLDRSLVSNVISLTDTDIEKSHMLSIDDIVVVNTNEGYKLYNVGSGNIEAIGDRGTVKVFPIIVLRNNLTYVKGNGSQFNPYVLGE